MAQRRLATVETDLKGQDRPHLSRKDGAPWDVLDELILRGELALDSAQELRETACRHGLQIDELLQIRNLVPAQTLIAALATSEGVQCADLEKAPPDAGLLAQIGAQTCLRLGVIPWRRMGRATIIATHSPHAFKAALPQLKSVFTDPVMALAPQDGVTAAILRLSHPTLCHLAERRVAGRDSCRTLRLPNWPILSLGFAGCAAFALLAFPQAILILLTAIGVVTLALNTVLKAAAAVQVALLPKPAQSKDAPYQGGNISRLPRISILVPLYKEKDIADHLVRNLQRLSYPRERLDVLLITEADDPTTLATLAETELPHWMRQLTVPPGKVRTKPRALNFALDHCRGSVIGVYDAEDAPETDQLLTIAAHYARAAPDVACLQGRLDFYNPHENWLARCFALEYAAWFRVVLPGLAKLGFAVPLGGTTLFFRRGPLEEIGGWDAHNVTEDADLGLRLARRGYRTELVETTTFEEANCRAWPWVRQRSRWLKGYAITYAVHMRAPVTLWKELGAWQFFGFQVMFACALTQFMLAPLLISFWLMVFTGSHPALNGLPWGAILGMSLLFVTCELVNVSVAALGISRTKHSRLKRWAPSLHFYFPLGALAAYKGFYELFGNPFYWDKTNHGVSKTKSE